MKALMVPTFAQTSEAFEYVKTGKKPIVLMILGTMWSPPSRYTMQSITDLMEDESYAEKVEVFFIDQDQELDFCFSENIYVGFPTILVFVNSYLVPFASGHAADPSKAETKNRLIHQCNKKQMKTIVDGAISVLEGKAENITVKFEVNA